MVLQGWLTGMLVSVCAERGARGLSDVGFAPAPQPDLGVRYVDAGAGFVEVVLSSASGATLRHGGANASLASAPSVYRQRALLAQGSLPQYCHSYSPAHHGDSRSSHWCYLDVPKACPRAPRHMKPYACVFVVTKLKKAYLEMILQSVRRLRTRTRAWIVVVLPKDESVVPDAAVAMLKRLMAAADEHTIVYVHPWPVAPQGSGLFADQTLMPWFVKLTEDMPNCCAWREYFKLISWKLDGFRRILFLDLDVHVITNVDYLFGCPAQLHALYAAGPNGPWQGGFFVVAPSRIVYVEMLRRLHGAQYSRAQFWFNSAKQLPLHFREPGRCYGCEGPQGFLFWFFVLHKHHLHVHELDACVYDAISPLPSCAPLWASAGAAYRLKTIHKYSTHDHLPKCVAQAAQVASHVRAIVGTRDARELFYVGQCKLRDKPHDARRPAGASVLSLCYSHGTCH
ncbi:hypothetical protein KFE25_000874 [Diacronema lutheri]|uniref:Hexosyltransferase n=3 Tax=Diacronema lutheri TaxID=2081491 RepID=A0A8J6CHB0_DIALT|nr:hypothetical protein KFE25_000874 [Diacronema lutheri]